MHTQPIFKTITLIIVVLLLAIPAFAQEMMSNLPADGVYEGWCSPVAVGFEVPAGNNYRLTNLRAALRHMNDDSLTLVLYRDNDGLPGARIATISTQTVTSDAIYDFVPGDEVVLEGGQTYWIYADASACNATWDDLGEAQPSGAFSVIGYVRQTEGWVDATLNGHLMPAFALEATALNSDGTPLLATDGEDAGA